MPIDPDDADFEVEYSNLQDELEDEGEAHDIGNPQALNFPCRRCGLATDPALTCPHCLAPSLITPATSSKPDFDTESFYLFKAVLVGFVLQMAPALGLGWVMLKGHLAEENRKWWILGLEVWDFLVVLGFFAWMGRVALAMPSRWVKLLTWLAMPVCLGSVLVINQAYHLALKEYLKVEVKEEFEWELVWILMIAVQPAIVEELFFRYLALGSMAQIMNIHSAIFITSVLFALAHIYAPLSLPIFFLAGLFLGYMRVGSGGLLLPMIAHFLHNFTILWIETSP